MKFFKKTLGSTSLLVGQPNLSRRRLFFFSGSILLILLFLTYLSWSYVYEKSNVVLKLKFDEQANKISTDILKRMDTYEQVLRGVQGLFGGGIKVQHDDLHRYIDNLHLDQKYPGIQAIRWSPIIHRSELERHVLTAQQEVPRYAVFPPTQNEVVAPVLYAEPDSQQNQEILGFDMLSDQFIKLEGDPEMGVRSTALGRAASENRAILTRSIRLQFAPIQETQAGFLVVLPVYHSHAKQETPSDRKNNLIGWVSGAFRTHDLMEQTLDRVTGAGMDVHIYDGDDTGALIYDSAHDFSDPERFYINARFKIKQSVLVSGQRWLIEVTSSPAFERQNTSSDANITAASGIALSLLLTLFTFFILRSRFNALCAAETIERAGYQNEMLLRTSSDGIFIFDLDGNVKQVNDAFCRMLGYTREVMLNMNLSQWNAQWTREVLLAKVAALGVDNSIFETVHRRSDGSLIDVEISTSRVEIDGQSLVYSSARNITERKIVEHALKRSELRLKLLLDSAAEAIYGIDLNGNCTFCNPACLKTLGYQQKGDLINKNMHQLIHHHHADKTPYMVEDCKIYLALHSMEETHVDNEVFWRADGSSFPVEYWSHPQIQDGKVVGSVITFLDISERLEVSKKLLKLSKAVESSPVSVVITDLNGIIEYVNPRFTEVTGYTQQEVLGQNPRILKSGNLAPKFYEELWKTILSGGVWKGEFQNKKKSGELYFEAVTISPIQDWNGLTTNFVAVKDDITERKRNEQALKRSIVVAETANRAKSDFLANMSHEIRTPMNSIIGFSQLCLQTKLTVEQREFIETVFRSSTALLGIINDILDYSKIEAGKLKVEEVPFFLSDILSGVKDVTQQTAAEKGLNFGFYLEDGTPLCLVGDPLRLGQILKNLVGNAMKFTREGQVNVHFSVENLSTAQSNEAGICTLKVEVADTGIGMTTDQVSQLFQSFSQADTSTTRQYGGTGLGLAISQRLADLMGGKIEATSTFGCGSVFTLRLPIAFLPSNSIERELPAATLTDYSGLTGLRVLLVEDNEFNQHLAIELLSRVGVSVSVAANGLEAVEAAQPGWFDAILMDMQMPVMGGLEATRLIREDPALSNLPIIAMTANAMSGDRQACLDAGMNDYLSKPVHPDQLYTVLAHHTHRVVTGIDSSPLTVYSDEEVLSVQKITTLLGSKTYLSVLQRFSVDQRNGKEVALIGAAIETHDFIAAKRLAHTLKGVAATIGAFKLSKTAQMLEVALHQQHGYTDLLVELAVEIEHAMTAVNDHLGAVSDQLRLPLGEPIPPGGTMNFNDLFPILAAQLAAFDTAAGDTMRRFIRQASPEVIKKLQRLSRLVSDYDYEGAATELKKLNLKEMKDDE